FCRGPMACRSIPRRGDNRARIAVTSRSCRVAARAKGQASSMNTKAKGGGAPLLVDLALQGGGAHGAFTWGVLDRLLEEPRLEIEGISGTSAGAMNAAVLISGQAAGGAEGAKAALEQFWRRVSDAALLSPFRRTPLDVMLGRWTLDT